MCFYILIFVSCDFNKLIFLVSTFGRVFRFFHVYIFFKNVICEQRYFYFLISNFDAHISFTSLFLLIFPVLYWTSSESGHDYLVLHQRSIGFNFSLFKMILAVELSYVTFFVLRYFSSSSNLFKSFYHHGSLTHIYMGCWCYRQQR